MKILVTGSNGLLGQKLTALLGNRRGIELVATARTKSAVEIGGEFRLLDITNEQEVDAVLEEVRPDVVINAAAMTQVDPCEVDREACWRANVSGVEYLIKASHQLNAHLIHVSTDFVFDGTKSMLDEQDTPNPVNYYGESKLAAEKLVQKSKGSWCIIRTVLVYGITHDMSRSNIVVWVKNSLEAGKTIQVVSDQYRTPTLAEDLAMGCLLAAQRNAQGLYHVSGKDHMSVFDIAQRSAAFFNLDVNLIKPVTSASFVQPGKRPLKTGFVIDKARKDLGFEPHSFEEGLAVLADQIK